MDAIIIKQILDRLYPKMSFPGSTEFGLLCDFKNQIQDSVTNELSDGEKMSIAHSLISESVFSKLTKVGRNIYESAPDNDNLFLISFAIAKITEEFGWKYNYYSPANLSYISKRIEDQNLDLGILLTSHLKDIDVYCTSSKNWALQNLPQTRGFIEDVENFKRECVNLSINQVYEKIEEESRAVVVNQYHWDEYDVEGLSWAIGTFSLISVYSGIVDSFENVFKSVYIKYLNKGLDRVMNNTNCAIYFAECGNPNAQFKLGLRYYNGQELPKDNTKAAFWFEKAAELGHATAQYNIGQCYEKAIGVRQSDAKALYWYSKAAENGDVEAISNLGMYHYTGKGTPVNYEKAVQYWDKASKHDDARATYNLGICYREGQGVPIDHDIARQLFQKAMALGHPNARLALNQLDRFASMFGL